MQNDFQPAKKPDPSPPQPLGTKTPEAAVANSLGAAALKPKKRRFAWWRGLNRNVRFGIIAVLLLIFGGGAIFYYQQIRPDSDSSLTITKHTKPAPTTVASPLTGVQVDPALAARPVTGIMIENSDFARPQSGLQDAGVVYEAIAEGGVTRFLALFQEAKPQYVGPVRSLRPYYIDYAAPFQASIIHVGGSPDALREVRNGHFRDLDQFFNAGAFTRISAREAPHNVYTSFKKIDALNKAKGYRSSKFTSWPRKADQKLVKPSAKSIQFAISGPDFYASYTYKASGNYYVRSEGGVRHLDLVSAKDKTGVFLHPKVVIGLVVPLSSGALDASGAYYSNYDDIGKGVAYIFQDGGLTKATWRKTSTNNQISFISSTGKLVKLDAGQTWITLVSSSSQVTYSP